MHKRRSVLRKALVGMLVAPVLGHASNLLFAQSDSVNTEIVDKIKQEGMERSKVMETISYLTDVSGPRLTGSPETKLAGEWAKKRLEEYGLENAHLEPWGPFGRGWSLQSYRANVTAPNFFSLIAYPKAWTPSTPTTVRGEPIYLDANTPEELEKYRGKLGRAIVLISPPRELKPWFDPPGARQTDSELLNLANAEIGGSRRRRPPGVEPGTPAGGLNPPSSNTTPSTPSGDAKTPATTPASGGAADGQPPRRGNGAGIGSNLTTDKWQMCYDEGAAVVLEAGRGDGGTVFVASATMPRRADPQREIRSPGEGGPMSRGARPWTVDSPPILPQMVVSAEHYNRLVRMVQKGVLPQLEIDIESTYHDGDTNCFNIIAEIPGSDLKDEVVMIGAHFDSWHSGTGATDNAIGCGVMMEAMRILKSIGVAPRRTIRIALWTGEEQGLLGSRAYVSEHFGTLQTPQRGGGGEGGDRTSVLEYKPEYEKLSTYFNLDNGAGKIRGIYLQGNEAARPIFRAWLSPFADYGASTVTAANTGGTDHQSFTGIGLPGFQFIQDPIEYDTRTHHSSMDVYERLIEEDAKQSSVIIATFAYQAAMRDEKIPRRALEGNPTMQPAGAKSD
ncbi:MAG: M20/M25/M40 family metallo-hydrolase [Planctomycetaceae bacterium]|jgi:carboxypeptidase Q|nr:M20/M25/M40 family metallo-hydrolase [Planctomycetaceae bacterium]